MMVLTTGAIEAQSTWTTCNSSTTEKFVCVFMPEVNKVLVGSTNGIMLMSTDYGNTFSTIPLGAAEDINALYFFNAQNGIMFFGRDFLKSSNGGLTWSFVSKLPGKPKAMHFLDPDTGFVACDEGEAFSTFNGGNSWNALSTGVTERLEAVCFKHPADGFLGGRNNTSLRTLNMGLAFSTGVIPADGDIKDIQFVTETNGYSCGDNGEILFTGDGGSSWNVQPIPSGEPGMNALHFTDALNGWCSGEAGVIFHTSNGGTTWLNDNSNTSSELNNIHLFDNQHGFAVGDNGTIVRLGGSITAVSETNKGLDNFSIHPNPVRSTTTVSYSLPGKSDITFKMFGLLGNDIKTLPQGTLEAGQHKMTVDCSDLPDGIYFYALEANGSKVKSGQLIVSR